MNKRAFLLITALLIIVILMLVGMGFLGSQVARYRAALRAAESSQARQLALSGLEDARIKMELDENFPPKGAVNQDIFSYSEKLTINSVPPVNGTYTVVINSTYAVDPAAVIFVTAIGTVGAPESPISQYRLKAELDFRDTGAAVYYETYGPARPGAPAGINATRFFRYTRVEDEETP